MVTEPYRWVDWLVKRRLHYICAHIESLCFPLEFLNKAHKCGVKAGLALHIATPVEIMKPFWMDCDMLLIMTSEPDGGDESIYPLVLQKAKDVMMMIGGKCTCVFVDGGIGEKELVSSGVAGVVGAALSRLVFGSNASEERLMQLSIKEKAPVRFVVIQGIFGRSGNVSDLFALHGLTAEKVAGKERAFL